LRTHDFNQILLGHLNFVGVCFTALRFIETNGLKEAFADKESLEWWEEHKEADAMCSGKTKKEPDE